jgi:hypothetical protein
MARHESDREDLLREATALVERAELQAPGESEPITAGFRRDGSLSVYFGADPVYQFNAACKLRRAFVGGLLYKAQGGHLVELRRERTQSEVVLVRRELDAAEAAAFLEAARDRLRSLHAALVRGEVAPLGQVPPDADVPLRLGEWLARISDELSIACSPRVS